MKLGIKYLDLSRNFGIDDRCMKSLGEYMKNNKSIEFMIMSNTTISDEGIEILTPYLGGNTTFKSFIIENNEKITDKCVLSLVMMVESSHIQRLDIAGTLITQSRHISTKLVHNVIKYESSELQITHR